MMLPYEGKFPKCFNSRKEYFIWLKAARVKPSPRFGFCTDCTIAYKEKMALEGRCSYASVFFVRSKEGGLEGRLPWSEVKKIRNKYAV